MMICDGCTRNAIIYKQYNKKTNMSGTDAQSIKSYGRYLFFFFFLTVPNNILSIKEKEQISSGNEDKQKVVNDTLCIIITK